MTRACFWLPLLMGCTNPASYGHLRSICDVDDAVALPYGEDFAVTPLSTACAGALAGAVGLDWQSFGDSPHAVSGPGRVVNGIVGAQFVFVAADFGPVADLRLDASGALTRALLDQRKGDDGSAGEFWLDYVSDEIDVVRSGNGDDPVLMQYGMGIVDVFVSDNGDDYVDLYEHPAFLAGALVHEATHGMGSSHVDCGDGEVACDEDGAGAWGAQIDFVESWLRMNEATVGPNDDFAVRHGISMACGRILDVSSLAACASLQ